MYRIKNFLRRLKRNYDFKVTGMFEGKKETFHYIKKGKKVKYYADEKVQVLFEICLRRASSTGVVGQRVERDINDPFAVLCILADEVFDEIIETEGILPEADDVPPGAMC